MAKWLVDLTLRGTIEVDAKNEREAMDKAGEILEPLDGHMTLAEVGIQLKRDAVGLRSEEPWTPPTHPGSDPARRGPGPIA